MNTTERLTAVCEAVITGNIDQVAGLIEVAVNEGISPELVMNQGLIAAMTEVGERFEKGDFYVPEMLVSARAMESGLAILKPLLVSQNVKAAGTVIIGTVQGDLHDIGKNLVAMMLRGGGFDVIDLGVDVSSEMFLEKAQEHKPDLVAMSALLTTTMTNMKKIVNAFSDAGIRDDVKIIVGGAPVTEEYALEINANGFAPDAHAAVRLAVNLLQ